MFVNTTKVFTHDERWIKIQIIKNLHNTPVLHGPAGREVCTGQHRSVPVRQLYLYERMPIGKFSQTVTYAGPYRKKSYDQFE